MMPIYGLKLQPGKGKKVTAAFDSETRLSSAVLEPNNNPKALDKSVSVYIHDQNNTPLLLCVLDHKTNRQCPIDLMLEPNETATFEMKGEGIVHITGYAISSRDFWADSDEESYEVEEGVSDEEDEEDAGEADEEEPDFVQSKKIKLSNGTPNSKSGTPSKIKGGSSKSSPAASSSKSRPKPLAIENGHSKKEVMDDESESDDEDFEYESSESSLNEEDSEDGSDFYSDDEDDEGEMFLASSDDEFDE